MAYVALTLQFEFWRKSLGHLTGILAILTEALFGGGNGQASIQNFFVGGATPVTIYCLFLN
jgi:hypothetical protein